VNQRKVSQWRVALGDIIREVRERKEWTQADVAASLSWARTTVVQIEKGQQATSFDQLVILADLFRVHVSDLIPGEVDRSVRARY